MTRQDINQAFLGTAFLDGANATYVEAMQARYDKDPGSVPADWRDFHLGDGQAVRGWANTGDWRGPFLRLSYRAGPDSALAQAGARLSESIGCRIAIPNGPSATVPAHYDTASARYAVELWGRNQDQLRSALGPRGQASVDQGALVGRPDKASRAVCRCP